MKAFPVRLDRALKGEAPVGTGASGACHEDRRGLRAGLVRTDRRIRKRFRAQSASAGAAEKLTGRARAGLFAVAAENARLL